jgi:hypothetical protein
VINISDEVAVELLQIAHPESGDRSEEDDSEDGGDDEGE